MHAALFSLALAASSLAAQQSQLVQVQPSQAQPALPIAAPNAPILPPALPANAAHLATVAEQSAWQATSTSEQVVSLLDAIAASTPSAFRTTLGLSHEGREMPVIVLSDPPVQTPEAARELAAKEGRAVVMLFGNIHAGEVDAKEAYLMLARELALGMHADLLKHLIIIIAPNYNPDGNDLFKPIDVARPGQQGPAAGAGQRHNAMDRDLNRDWGKLDTPEARNIVGFINAWDPHVIIDGHTTNGSWHRYLMTYAGPKVPAGDPRLIAWTRDDFFPRIDCAMLDNHGIHTFFYGDFEGEYAATDPNVADGSRREHTKWTTFPALPRYSTGYLGLRNRIGILSESYSYSSYRDRIVGSRAFALEVLREVANDRARIRQLIAQADEDGAGLGATASRPIAIRGAAGKAPQSSTLLGYIEERRHGKWINTGEERSYEVEVWNRYEPTKTVTRPHAYAFISPVPEAVENLRLHGIAVETLTQETRVAVEQYTIDSASPASREFQGHVLISVEATPQASTMVLPAGTVIVPTNQPLGILAAYLLEPACEDGLATWNFFDAFLKPGSVFPVVRVMENTGNTERAGGRERQGLEKKE